MSEKRGSFRFCRCGGGPQRRFSFMDWFLVFRPWSCVATFAPFLAGAGFEFRRPSAHWGGWCLGLVSGLLLHATANLLNSWGDEKSGVDSAPGAFRTTPQIVERTVSMRALLRAALVCAALGAAAGLASCFYRADGAWRFNIPLLAAGAAGFLGAANYTTGVRYKYLGLGVPASGILMGAVELFAARALLAPEDAPRACASPGFLLASVSLALLIGAVMHGNDMRDMLSDRAAGITTLASRLGPRGALAFYVFSHVVPYALCAADAARGRSAALLPLLCLPLSAATVASALRVFRANPQSPPWRGLERASGMVLTVFSTLYAASLALAPA